MSDLIRREDAINLCEKWRNRTNEHHDKNGWYIADTLLKAIKELPSADRPQGEWKDRTYGGRILHPWWESCECSQCEEWGSGAWNFCPNCGCRMKGADDE